MFGILKVEFIQTIIVNKIYFLKFCYKQSYKLLNCKGLSVSLVLPVYEGQAKNNKNKPSTYTPRCSQGSYKGHCPLLFICSTQLSDNVFHWFLPCIIMFVSNQFLLLLLNMSNASNVAKFNKKSLDGSDGGRRLQFTLIF